MVKKILLILILLGNVCYADTTPVAEVVMRPLSIEISFSSVTLDPNNWETMPTVEMRGRRELHIVNTSTTENVYLGATGSSVLHNRTLYPRQEAWFKISSDLSIYASASTVVTLEIVEIK